MPIAQSPLNSVFWNLGDAYPKRSGVVDVQRTEGAIPHPHTTIDVITGLSALSEPGRDYPESKRRPITRSLFHLSINCFILSTTPDKSLATSSFLKRITLSPKSDSTFSRLASSSRCKSWMSPSTSMTSDAL